MQREAVNKLIEKPHLAGAATMSRAVVAAVFVAATALPAVGAPPQSGSEGGAQQPAPHPFTVEPRIDKLFFYPCNDCHSFMDTNKNVRELDVEEGHPANLEHGKDLIWCFSCHSEADYDQLQSLRADPIDFDRGYQVCGGCHSQKYRDWSSGAHGKRVTNWRGERELYSCIQCHNPHKPAIQPRAPQPPPPIRAGLKPMTPDEEYQPHDPRRPEWEHLDAR